MTTPLSPPPCSLVSDFLPGLPILTPPRFLVCAGSTRERIDQVRDWGNIFTGGTGFDLARALAAYGPVDLVTSNRDHLAQLAAGSVALYPIRGFGFSSHADLRAAAAARMAAETYDAVVMSAAVSDYTPDGCFAVMERQAHDDRSETWQVRNVQAGKVSSQHAHVAILGRQTEKIVDLFRNAWGHQGLLVKFKLEVGITEEKLIEIGEASRRASKADVLVANTLEMVEGASPGAWILGDGSPRWTARASLAGAVSALIYQRLHPSESLTAPTAQAPALAITLAKQCRSLSAVLATISPSVYTSHAHGSSIGEHIRHGLDHLKAVLHGLNDGVVDYEQRRRGWAGERDLALALTELAEIAEVCLALRPADLNRPVKVRCVIDAAVPPVELMSNLARELLFVLSHENHHAAILSRILVLHGLQPPADFDLAPSTVSWRNATCAASA